MTKRLVPPLVYLQVQTAEVVPGTSKSARTSEAEIYKDLKTHLFFFSFCTPAVEIRRLSLAKQDSGSTFEGAAL